MYLVISQWRPVPGREEDFDRISATMRQILRGQPGVKFLEAIKGPDCFYAVHGYENEETYKKIIEDPHGPFNRAANEHMVEEVAEWLGSVKGTSVD